MSRYFYVGTHLKFTSVNKIEAMYEVKLNEVQFWASIKPGTWNIPEHTGT